MACSKEVQQVDLLHLPDSPERPASRFFHGEIREFKDEGLRTLEHSTGALFMAGLASLTGPSTWHAVCSE